MSVPDPPTSLDNSCSVIYDNTLYSYSPQGFQSLRLEEGAEWKQLSMGQKVTGATCVGTTPGDASQSGLFIVGGKADSTSYTGLQKFTYSTNKWTTITPSDLVTQNRQWHGSTYIPADDVILVYAGSQDGVQGPSSQTFTIKASEPYKVHSFGSDAIPAVSPILMSWSSADAAMMSGDGTNSNIYWFNPTAGWRDSGASLAQPVRKAGGSMDAVLVAGTDNSRSIYVFDLSQSPNHVGRAVVQDASGRPITNSALITTRSLADDVLGQRDLTVDNWPKYNSSLAPTVTRQKFSTAQSPDNLIVFSGGNAKDSLSLFDASHNSWLNTTDLFAGQKASIQSESTATSTLPHPTSPHGSSATPAIALGPTDLSVPPMQTAGSSSSSELTPNGILGITLGIISGFLVLLGLILFILRVRRRRKARANVDHAEAGHPRRATGPSAQEKELGLVTNTNLSPPSPGYFRHQHQASQDSVSSMAILMGRVNQQMTRRASVESNRTSTSSMHRQLKSAFSKPLSQAQQNPLLQIEDDKGVITTPTIPESSETTRHEGAGQATRRSSGWNRYWSGGSALNILGFGASKRNTVGSEPSSRYSEGPDSARPTRESAVVPPLIFQTRPELNRVNSKSPIVSTYPDDVPWKEGITGSIEGDRPVSPVSSRYSSGIPESVHDSWNPTSVEKPWGADRAPSSVYAPSAGKTLAPAALGVSKQPQLAMATTSTDMSWLNLGDNRDSR